MEERMAQKTKKKKMRLGRVVISMAYVVDLDNQEMVAEAKDCLFEDAMNAVKYDELGSYLEVMPDKKATPGDIPEFLLHEEEKEEEEV
jgi:hypothetical protein